jgi:protein-disulfide isomerase
LNEQKLKEIALELKLDQKKFEKDMNDPKIRSMVQRDFQDAQKAGVRSVPSVFVNGRLLKNRSIEGFSALIDKALKQGSAP